ncbi:MAG: AAA family ATPase [Dysosmobacter sp.]|nr:AAA family ATPase [uncultured Oscillibacter sp.]MCX4371844.1 AAA family ATPase [Dysosmobacter sp.]
MRLQRISIGRYKNLRNFDCVLSDSNTSAFIGNNGSGKSNLLEAIAAVFSFAKNSTTEKNSNLIVTPDIEDCSIEYVSGDHRFVLRCTKSDVSIFDGETKLSRREIPDALPSAILLYYAGETTRQARTADTTFDEKYNNRLKKAAGGDLPGYKFLDYYSTKDLGLLLLTAAVYRGPYYERLLELLGCAELLPQFHILLKNPKGRAGSADTYWNAQGFVKNFLNQLRRYVAGTRDLSAKYIMFFRGFDDFTSLAEHESELFAKLKALQNAGYLDRMFLSLKRTDGTEFPFDTLSEGEKQLSLLFLLLSFTAHDDCLYLFDEFDAYLHLNWQKAFAKTIHSVDINGHMIFTTHSPATVSGMHKKDVYIMSNGQAGPAPSETYNRSLDEIMEEHMLVSMRPAEYNESVQAFRGAVMRGNRAEAEAVLARIREIVGESDPFFITARIALNRME